ncbi:hypothetical protein SteCoe_25648 [Stentor coeruleus]|uniref:Arrestin-like N-terminal domain-containing protein n=1 Tax=Stentor coeruleus TaxID=5963 RepID=A0A1R2BEQ4_9CILI|nr:hypothetical protein SteCoe_25648 [Stentor coeruleus]
MGQETSKYNIQGGIHVHLDNFSTTFGEEVNGTIYIHLEKEIGPSTLLFEFKGKEISSWSESRSNYGSRRHKSKVVHYKETKNIFSFEKEIHRFEDRISIGNFSVPFTFKLPSSGPGSLNYNYYDTNGIIQYKIVAKLLGSAGENYKGWAKIDLSEPSVIPNKDESSSSEGRISSWCCVDKGNCKINVTHPESIFTRTSRPRFTIDVDATNSKIDITEVYAKLVGILSLKANDNRDLIAKDIVRETNTIRIPAGGVMNGIVIDLDLNKQDDSTRELFTSKGKLVECVFHVEIGTDLDGWFTCCGNNPNINYAVSVIPEKINMNKPPKPPNGWNPNIFEHIYLAYQ